MARNTQQTCRAVMARLRQQGFEYGANRNDIILAVHEVAGSTHDTREKYMRELKQRRFIAASTGQGYDLNHEVAESEDDTSIIAELSGRINALEARITELEAATCQTTTETDQ